MNRRNFLQRAAALVAAGVAADQLELLERLTWRRTMFPAASVEPRLLATLELFDSASATWWAVQTKEVPRTLQRAHGGQLQIYSGLPPVTFGPVDRDGLVRVTARYGDSQLGELTMNQDRIARDQQVNLTSFTLTAE